MSANLRYLRMPDSAVLGSAVFPAANHAALKTHRAVTAQKLASATDGACFFHPANRADDACVHCGRFVCALCALPIGGQTVCPSCVMEGRKTGRQEEFVDRRVLWDHRVFALGVLPLVLPPAWFALPALGLVALILAAVHWKKPGSLVRTSRWRMTAGLVGAVVELVAGGLFWLSMFVS